MSNEEKFAADVLACVDDLNALIPSLTMRYDNLVIVAALAEHVGGALRIFMETGVCSPVQARRLIEHIEDSALAPVAV